MTKHLHPADVLYAGIKPLPALPACEHYAGNEKLISKALQLQSELGSIFDITADCEDGAPAGQEKQHAGDILAATQDASWGPIKHEGKLHDRASYRFYWELLQRAHSTGMKLPAAIQSRFFT